MRLRLEGCALCQELGHLQLPPWVCRGDVEAQPVPILTGLPRVPRAGRLHAVCPLPCWEETPPCRELAVGRGGQVLPSTPAAVVPRAGAGGGGQRWAAGPAPSLLVVTTRPRHRPAPPGRALLPLPPYSACCCARSLRPISVLRGRTDKAGDREESPGQGGGWGGLAEPRAWIQRRGPSEGRLGDDGSPFTTHTALAPSCERLGTKHIFRRVGVCFSLLKISSPCHLRGQGRPAP